MVMPCSRSARRPSVSSARLTCSSPCSRLTRSTASIWSLNTVLVSYSSLPMRVLLPSSTDPAVANLRMSILEIPLTLAVLHGCFAELVVATGGSALGDPRDCHLVDDLVDGVGVRHDRGGEARVAHGAVAHPGPEHLLVGLGRLVLVDAVEHPLTLEDVAVVGVVDGGQLDALPLDVVPDVELGPVREREDADALPRVDPAVVEVPDLGPLVLGVPLAEVVAEREDPLLRPGLVLVATGAAEDRGELVLVERLEQDRGLRPVAGAVRRQRHPSVVDRLLHAGDDELQAQLLDALVTEGQHLLEVVPGVHVQHRERDARREERLLRQAQHDDGVLAAGEEQDGLLELRDDLTHDVDRLGLEDVELAQLVVRAGGVHVVVPSLVSSRMTESRWSATSGRQINRSGRSGSSRLYSSREPSIRLVCRPAARATATGAAESHSYWPPACT